MNQYHSFWNMASPLLNSMIQNPYNNSSYALNLSQQTNAAQTLGRQAISNAFSNLRTMGMGDSSSGLKAALGANMSRFGSALTQRGFMNAANQANADKWNALGIQSNRSPLQTGQTQTQTKSGLGTWLPQLLGGAASLAMAPFTGGASLLGMSQMGQMGGGQGAFQNSMFTSPFTQPGGGASAFMPTGANAYNPMQMGNIPFPQ
jgi:hypothetical protein